MLKVYAAEWCPHCRATVDFLRRNHIPFEYVDMDSVSRETEKKLDEVNGGEWIVPTLEWNGQWRPGRKFSEAELRRDLKNWGIES